MLIRDGLVIFHNMTDLFISAISVHDIKKVWAQLILTPVVSPLNVISSLKVNGGWLVGARRLDR